MYRLYYPKSTDLPRYPSTAQETHEGNPQGFCEVFPLEEDVMFMYRMTESHAMHRLLIDMWAYSPEYAILMRDAHVKQGLMI
jgi:hypothetical protein